MSKTIEIIKKSIQEHINEDQMNNNIYLKVFDALKKHDGETITKRLANSVEKTLGPEYNVKYCTNYGMYNIEVKFKSEPYDKYRRFLIGYDSDPERKFRLLSGDVNASKNSLYSERGFDYFSICYGKAAADRIAENKKFLKSSKIQELADCHDEKIEIEKRLKKIKSFPAYFSVEKALGGTIWSTALLKKKIFLKFLKI